MFGIKKRTKVRPKCTLKPQPTEYTTSLSMMQLPSGWVYLVFIVGKYQWLRTSDDPCKMLWFHFSSKITLQLHNGTGQYNQSRHSTWIYKQSLYFLQLCSNICLLHCMNLTASELKWQPTRLSVLFSFPVFGAELSLLQRWALMEKQERVYTCAYFHPHAGKFQIMQRLLYSIFCLVVKSCYSHTTVLFVNAPLW